MNKSSKLMLGTTLLALAFGLPARGEETPAPAKGAAVASASQPAAAEGKAAKPAVAPHNHMRDGKGHWVPEKKPRKAKPDAAAKASASAEAGGER